MHSKAVPADPGNALFSRLLDRLEVEEGHDEVVSTAWVGWKTGAVHLRNPRVTAAGSVIRFHEVVLAEPLAQRPTH